MTQYACNIGERIRVEGLVGLPQSTKSSVLVFAEDRFRVMNPGFELVIPHEGMEEIVTRAKEEIWKIGSIVPRYVGERLVFDVVVYDLDRVPIIELSNLERGLEALFLTVSSQQLMHLAMEPVGVAHGGVKAREFAFALRCAALEAPIGLQIQICDLDETLLDEIFDALQDTCSTAV